MRPGGELHANFALARRCAARYLFGIEPIAQERAVFQFFGAGGRELHHAVGHDARYRFRGDETYVRVRIGSTAGCWAWTQPVFLDDLAGAIRWTNA